MTLRRSVLLALALLITGCEEGGPPDSETTGPVDAGTQPDSGTVAVILDGGGDPASPPDGVSACPAGICNYQSGSGCPASAPACLPVPNGASIVPECSPSSGTGKAGDSCAQVTDCAPGYMCAEGKCRKMCCGGDWTGCDSAKEACFNVLSYSDGMGGAKDTGAMLCYPKDTCDALDPSSCQKAGTACMIVDATGATGCIAPGKGQTGDPCPCAGGFTCVAVTAGSPPTCHRLCGAVPGGAPPYCQTGEGVCTHKTRDPAGVGECL